MELVHSHHASIDIMLATLLSESKKIKQVVTMHGMYELLSPPQFKEILPLLKNRIDRFVYTADKNLAPFSTTFQMEKRFVKIDNALAVSTINQISRSELGIEKDDFVLCLVSRAIPEKGWEEGIAAVTMAQANCKRKIHLILIGEGVEYDRLKGQIKKDFIHFLGFKSNIRDYFAMADIGFLPSRFKGESFPLVIIDCLHTGKPVLASNIGEISRMLDSGNGLAGELFDLNDFQIPIEKVSEIIVQLAENNLYYQTLLANASSIATKFDPSVMAGKYEVVYQSLLA